jgi:hypothetical protein
VDTSYKTEPLVIAGMIENDQMILALARPQSAPDGLDKPNARFRRPGIDYAPNV